MNIRQRRQSWKADQILRTRAVEHLLPCIFQSCCRFDGAVLECHRECSPVCNRTCGLTADPLSSQAPETGEETRAKAGQTSAARLEFPFAQNVTQTSVKLKRKLQFRRDQNELLTNFCSAEYRFHAGRCYLSAAKSASQLTHKTLQLAVPQRCCPHAVRHQSEEGLLHLPEPEPEHSP